MPNCALCTFNVEQLIDSHLIPRSVYSHVSPLNNPKIQINTTDAFHTTKQVSTHLLCSICENLFSCNGETPMGMLWATKKGFPLLDKLRASEALEDDCFSGNVLSHKDQGALFYFAMSIIWRSSIWPEDINGMKNCLGEKYESEFRKYLLKPETKRPDMLKMIILVNSNTVDKFEDINACFAFPAKSFGSKQGNYEFIVLGMHFYLTLGAASDEYKNDFKIAKSDILLAIQDFSKREWRDDLSRRFNTEVTLRGKLSKDYPTLGKRPINNTKKE